MPDSIDYPPLVNFFLRVQQPDSLQAQSSLKIRLRALQNPGSDLETGVLINCAWQIFMNFFLHVCIL